MAKEAGEFEVKWTMWSTCMVTTAVWSCARSQSWWQFTFLVLNTGSEGFRQAEEVLSVHVGLWNSWSSWQVLTGQASQAVPEAKTQVLEEFDAAMEDYRSASKKILSSCPPPQEGEAVLCQHCLQCRPGGLDLNWGHCLIVKGKIREAPQSPDTPYIKEAGDSEVDSTITQVLGWVAAKCEVKWWNGVRYWQIGRLVQLGSRGTGPPRCRKSWVKRQSSLPVSTPSFNSWSWTLGGYWKGQGWDTQSLGESSK